MTPNSSRPTRQVRPLPDPERLGPRLVTLDDERGLAVSVYAGHATAVALCVFRDSEETQYALNGPTHGVWHGFVPNIEIGDHYGFRAWGPWQPDKGHRYNPTKLLLDPYGRGISGEVKLSSEIYSHAVGEDLQPAEPLTPSSQNSAGQVPYSVVVDEAYNSSETRPAKPRTPWRDTLIYEAHVRGLTKTLPDVPKDLRGTYAGVAHPATIAHLKSIGVTAIELLPIHANTPEIHLAQRDAINYWGYNTIGFFAPHPQYATQTSRSQGATAILNEVKGMVDLLHQEGIEVLIDVVYNHTAEEGTDGPTYSWRGLDSTTYYTHSDENPGEFHDVTGCGNTLDHGQTRVVQQTLDSLRYWVAEVGVDGFRYDLGVTLARHAGGFDPNHPLLVALRTDPILREVKHIAEPWDLGFAGWRTGQFPIPFAEWNDQFREATRTFWLTDPRNAADSHPGSAVSDLATRLAGSADMFGHGELPGARTPAASVNFVTAHDGFTMADLTTYEYKRNEANGENNQDGTNDNRSWNHGIEGPVSNDGVFMNLSALRHRSIRNMLGTLLFSAGTPMITAGDEIGRSQNGNNNAYCQDELSWLDWQLEPWQEDLLDTVQHITRLRAQYAVLRPDTFFEGQPTSGNDVPDAQWFGADAAELDQDAWQNPDLRTLQMLRGAPPTPHPEPGALLVLHGGLNPQTMRLALPENKHAELVWDSAWATPSKRSHSGEPAAGDFAQGNSNTPVPGIQITAEEELLVDPLSIQLYLVR